MTPQLVNAHTHLEFSSLSQPLGHPGIPITDWIPKVIHWRFQQSESDLQNSIENGLRESQKCGVAAIGEIATSPWYHGVSRPDHILVNWFVERLGSAADLVPSRLQEGQQWLAEAADAGCFPGISPHAPYSVCDELFEALIEWAVSTGLPVAMHLAETREEVEWVASGTGPFVNLFEKLRLRVKPPAHSGFSYYLNALASTTHALVVHGNYLEQSKLEFIGDHPNLHLVFCPRTHQFFRHSPYPLEESLKHGINVAVGTDSRASNPDLDVMSELRLVHRAYPQLSPQTIFELGTINGARALQLDDRRGSLTPGKSGQLLLFSTKASGDPWESIFGS